MIVKNFLLKKINPWVFALGLINTFCRKQILLLKIKKKKKTPLPNVKWYGYNGRRFSPPFSGILMGKIAREIGAHSIKHCFCVYTSSSSMCFSIIYVCWPSDLQPPSFFFTLKQT